MDVQKQKAIIIERFKEVDDLHLISAIKNLLDYASSKEESNIEIPESHQELVLERFEKSRKNPELLLNWDDAKKSLKSS